jgi:hypothetical protein
MKWLLRPSMLVLVSVALAVGAAVLVLGPLWQEGPANRAQPRPVPEGDQEIVWLNPATSAVAWERFVTALRQVQGDGKDADLEIDDANAFPPQTTTMPEVAVRRRGAKGRLWYRWCKLTGDLKIDDWVEALVRRRPPPLAVIGGGSSDRARDLAEKLRDVAARTGPAGVPLFLITTATADQVPTQDDPSQWVRLDGIHAGRTFRFCFSNRQMARAVSDFIWSQDELRPDDAPMFLVAWKDDPYSLDLKEGFHDVLADEQYLGRLLRRQALRAAVREWAWPAGLALSGGVPPGLDFGGVRGDEGQRRAPFWGIDIAHSVGTFNQPNRFEAEVATRLLQERIQHPGQRRPLLVVPATVQPARRFLRGLVRLAPGEAARFVIATGDGLDFNTIYRDRELTWPIQDLPFALVFFCHRNPVDPSAFSGDAATGIEDLRLYTDIVEATVEAAFAGGALVGGPDALAANLRAGPTPRFDADGNRPSGTGEYVVYLRPERENRRITPRAQLRVYRAGPEGGSRWTLVRQLDVDYTQAGPPADAAGGAP